MRKGVKVKMKTVQELREVLGEQVDLLRSGKTTVGQANAIVNAIGKFLHSIRLQMEYAKLQGRSASMKIPMLESGGAS